MKSLVKLQGQTSIANMQKRIIWCNHGKYKGQLKMSSHFFVNHRQAGATARQP